jgi:hypothetical protein
VTFTTDSSGQSLETKVTSRLYSNSRLLRCMNETYVRIQEFPLYDFLGAGGWLSTYGGVAHTIIYHITNALK